MPLSETSEKAARVVLSVTPAGTGTLLINGTDISNAAVGIEIGTTVGDVTRVKVELAAVSVDVDIPVELEHLIMERA